MFKGGEVKPADTAPKCEIEGTYDYKPCNATSKQVEEKPCSFVDGELQCRDDGDKTGSTVRTEVENAAQELAKIAPGTSKTYRGHEMRFCASASHYVKDLKVNYGGSGAKIGSSVDLNCTITRKPEKK